MVNTLVSSEGFAYAARTILSAPMPVFYNALILLE